MEREGREEERRGREERGRREGGEMRKGRRGIIVGGMVIGLLMGCNNGGHGGVAELEKKSSFYESVMKIGQGFQEIFGIFGDAFGLTIIKSDDQKNKVGEHFEKIKKGLEGTNGKLKELSGEISSAKNADKNSIKVVEDAIKGASEVFEKLIGSLDKLAGVTNVGAPIGDANNGSAVGSDESDVNVVIENINTIIDIAKEAKVDIKTGVPGSQVANGNGPNALAGNSAGAGDKLADEVSKADSWAVIDKIKNTKAKTGSVAGDNTNDAGKLAAGSGAASVAAKSNADLVAAVALKAMTKNGKFSATNADAVKGAATSAVNKVLGILDLIIRKTVEINLEKIRKAVEGIKYSETGESTEVKK